METTEQISAEELQAFRAYRAKQEEERQRQAFREQYVELVDAEVASAYTALSQLSEDMEVVKRTVFENFQAVIDMKTEQMGLAKEGGQYSHTFTNSDSTIRVTLGNYTIDSYRDTVEEGIRMVRGYLESLAKDDTSSALVSAVLKLLSRNRAGQIQASRVLQLRRLAEDSGSDTFLEGVRIIEQSYNPQVSKSYVRLDVKDEGTGEWRAVPLAMSGV